MELHFFPTMTELTIFKFLTTLLITSNEGAALPLITDVGLISEQIWFTPVILEVMRINALSLIMIVVLGTPLCLKVVDVELEVLILVLDITE